MYYEQITWSFGKFACDYVNIYIIVILNLMHTLCLNIINKIHIRR